MNYEILIEGQTIPMPEEIAGDDSALKSALSPYFPGAANAKFMRSEPKDDVITVTVVKQAGTKGAKYLKIIEKDGLITEVLVKRTGNKVTDDAELTKAILNSTTNTVVEDQVLRKLIDAPEGINPVMTLDQKLTASPAMNQCPFETMLKRDAEIEKVLELGENEFSNMTKTFRRLVDTAPQPAPMLTIGF